MAPALSRRQCRGKKEGFTHYWDANDTAGRLAENSHIAFSKTQWTVLGDGERSESDWAQFSALSRILAAYKPA